MSPEDDPQTDRIPSIDHMPSHRGWNPVAQSDDPASPTPMKLNGHPTITVTQPASTATTITMPKSNGTPANGTNSATSLPNATNGPAAYATNGSTSNGSNHKTANNNDVWSTAPVTSTTGLPRAEKNGWKELPQDEEEGRRTTTTTNGGVNGANGTLNGNGLTNGNGHSDKLAEQDPLTGVVFKEVDEDELSTCGLGACQPKWARALASTKCFMCVFLVAWVLQVIIFRFVSFIFMEN